VTDTDSGEGDADDIPVEDLAMAAEPEQPEYDAGG
jgi:hypothetical protein